MPKPEGVTSMSRSFAGVACSNRPIMLCLLRITWITNLDSPNSFRLQVLGYQFIHPGVIAPIFEMFENKAPREGVYRRSLGKAAQFIRKRISQLSDKSDGQEIRFALRLLFIYQIFKEVAFTRSRSGHNNL
ncbi:MAG: hypothetical protein WBE13_22295, partial [Candidatus Acidiferrum sp.]